MSDADRLSNDAILGINISNDQGPTSVLHPSLQTSTSQSNATAAAANRRRYRSDKLSPDILLSGRGLPKLLSKFKRFKFEKRAKQANTNFDPSRISKKKNTYCEDHHFNNLQRILSIYQAFGHELSPHLKFDRFITNLNKGVEDSYTKGWIREQVREEMRAKMEKETMIDAEEEARAAASAATTQRKSAAPAEEEEEEEEEEEQQQQQQQQQQQGESEVWSELFGGDSAPTAAPTAPTTADLSDNEVDLSQIRQTPMFSAYLRTSSQPAPSEADDINFDEMEREAAAASAAREAEEDAFDALAATEGGIQDFLNDDDEPETEESPHFSQYIAKDSDKKDKDKSQTFSDDQFSDDDADALLA